MSLWLCLRFHQLPLQCLERGETDPVVVLERQRVLRANDCAASFGIRSGMGTATVRALAEPEAVQLLERDTVAEERGLQQLCCWAYSITPTLYRWREDCLLLEVGGCISLYRGLPPLLREIHRGLSSRGYSVQIGLAATPRAAWLLSFTHDDKALAWERELESRLKDLPLTLLQQDFPGAVNSLRRAGLHTLGDVLALPYPALGRRCGQGFTQLLRQILGQESDLQPTFQPPAHFSDEYWFGYEVKANTELLPAIQLLLQSLCRFLRNTQLYTTEIQWQLIGADSKLRELPVRSTCSHSVWENWYQLTCIHVDRLQLHAGIEGLALHCHQLRPGEGEESDLFHSAGQREPLDSLLDRLRSRLGLQAVEKVACRDEHLPEFSLQVGTDAPGAPGLVQRSAQRPFWLIPNPQPLQSQEQHLSWKGPLTLLCGPERIEDNWWQQPVSRDYYIARGTAGQHYWIFRDRHAHQWFIHGIFA